MNRDDVTRMAREAGWPDSMVAPIIMDKLADFAKVVAAAAQAKEREACAKVLDEMAAQDKWTNYYGVAANAIRARGQLQ